MTITWSTITSSFGTTNINDVAYGSSYWVAVGNSGKIATATDPAGPWTQHSTPFSGSAIEVAHGGGYWVAVNSSPGKIAVATNPTGTWTEYSIGFDTDSSDTLRCVAYGNGVWVVAGSTNDGKLATATNPTSSWTLRTSSFGSSTTIFGVAFDNGIWVAAGENRQVAWATDPTGTWTQWTPPTGMAADIDLNSLDYGNGKWVVAGEGGSLATATDPSSTWTLRSVPSGFGPATHIRVVSYLGGGVWVAGGDSGQLVSTTDPYSAWEDNDPPFSTSTIWGAVGVGGATDAVVVANSGKLAVGTEAVPVDPAACERYVIYGESEWLPLANEETEVWNNTVVGGLDQPVDWYGAWDTPYIGFIMAGVCDGTAVFGAVPPGWTKVPGSEIADASTGGNDPGRSMIVYYKIFPALVGVNQLVTITCTGSQDPGPIVALYTSSRIESDNEAPEALSGDTLIVSTMAVTTTGEGLFTFPAIAPGWSHAVNTEYQMWCIAFQPAGVPPGHRAGLEQIPHGWNRVGGFDFGGDVHTLGDTGEGPGISWASAFSPTGTGDELGDFGVGEWEAFNPYENTIRWLAVMTAVRTAACPLNDGTWGDDTDYGSWGEMMIDNDNY